MRTISNQKGAQVYHFQNGRPVPIAGHIIAADHQIQIGLPSIHDSRYVEYQRPDPEDTVEELYVLESDLDTQG